jgi:NADH-quinone oxidoreductase subunit F
MSKKLLDKISIQGKTYEVYRKKTVTLQWKSYESNDSDEVVDKLRHHRGRGGAGFPAGLKWSFIDKKNQKPRHFVMQMNLNQGRSKIDT